MKKMILGEHQKNEKKYNTLHSQPNHVPHFLYDPLKLSQLSHHNLCASTWNKRSGSSPKCYNKCPSGSHTQAGRSHCCIPSRKFYQHSQPTSHRFGNLSQVRCPGGSNEDPDESQCPYLESRHPADLFWPLDHLLDTALR